MTEQTVETDERGGQDVPQDPDWTARNRRRYRAAVEVLLDEAAPISWAELTEKSAERVPLTAYDASTSSSGAVRAWTAMGFQIMTSYEHAGWLHATSEVGFRLTEQGAAALQQHQDPESLYQAAQVAYAEWDKLRHSDLQPPASASSGGILRTGSGYAHSLAVTDPVLGAWRTGGSALIEGRTIWTGETARELRDYLDGSESIDPALTGLMSDDARILASEAMLLLMSPFADKYVPNKRSAMRNPLMLMDALPPELPLQTSAHLEQGYVPGNRALSASAENLLHSFARLLAWWWSADDEARQRSWDDPWLFRELVTGAEGVDDRVIALVCLLAHPGSYTTVLNPADRERIVDVFGGRIGSRTSDTEKDLLAITLQMQTAAGEAPVLWETAPLLQQWSQDSGALGAWLVRGQDKTNNVPGWLKQGRATLAAGQFTKLPAEPTQDTLGSLVDERYADLQVTKRATKRKDVLNFVLGMRPGDVIATIDNDVLRLGTVLDGDTVLQSIGGKSVLVRPVSWTTEGSVALAEIPRKLRQRLRLSGGQDVLDLTEIASELTPYAEHEETMPPEQDEPAEPPVLDGDDENAPEPEQIDPPVLACDTAALAKQLHHADASWLDELLLSLNERKQVVLEGPPGTGKTYLVDKLLDACHIDAESAQRALVQFHPTYSYEDFVEGFRPIDTTDGGGQVSLALKDGPLKRIAEEARLDPSRPYVLVIDEINRANIAKVFGELYFLLEYRDHGVELLYGDGSQRFSLPENLFIIGTMNTADRSIALLDAAMRRRFVFLSMGSEEPALAGMLGRWAADNSRPAGLAELRDRLNSAMQKHGLDATLAFGPSYFMGESSKTAEGLRRLWRRELRPMLVEHHYGEGDVDKRYPFEKWLADLQPSTPQGTEAAAVGLSSAAYRTPATEQQMLGGTTDELDLSSDGEVDEQPPA